MENYLIPPEYCLVINAFIQTSSLREAALLLKIDPAALVRKAQKISGEFGLIEKVGNKWVVTDAGRRIAQWTDESIARQKSILNEKSMIRIASFTWLAEEVLIPHHSMLHEMTGGKFTWSFKTISSDLEKELINNRSDYVVTGFAPNDPMIAHKRIAVHPWLVIAPESWKKKLGHLKGNDLLKELQAKPYVRFSMLNPEQTLGFKPLAYSSLMVDGVIGIRTAVAKGLGWSCVPAMAINTLLDDGKIITLDLPVSTKDNLSLWWLRSRKDSLKNSPVIAKWITEITK